MGGMWTTSALMGLAQPLDRTKRWVRHASPRPSRGGVDQQGLDDKATDAIQHGRQCQGGFEQRHARLLR